VLIHRVAPSRLFPELVGARGLVATEDGTQRLLVDRMRIARRPDGSLERAAELLPGGSVRSVALPSRLGGGYLFHVNAGGGTEIWRAAGWLEKLTPLTRRNEVVSDIVAGFDRLYLKLASGNRLLALDAKTGEPMGLGPLPVAAAYGMLAFADGWRAVVDTDLRGPLATFDAGATWRAVDLTERTAGVGVVDGNPAVLVAGGRYVIDPRGIVTYHTDHVEPHERGDEPEHHDGDGLRPSPLGKRPLRAAVEDGWPDTEGTAVVARGGALARVSLRDGRVLALADDAYPEPRSTCHAVRLGLHGVGFVCGEREGPTVVYEYVAPLAMRQVLRFDKPRFVSASGNGALVLRGRCTDEPAVAASTLSGAGERPPTDESDARWYCVRSPGGDLREIRVKGFDLGIERVVGLGDGRIAVVVPPRGGSAGVLSIIDGGATASVPLALPTEPRSVAHELKRGMWLDGFEERQPGVLGGWVEAGGPFVGLEITLDGKVKAGELRDDPQGGIFGGRFAVALGDGGHASETSDGGMTWTPFDLPEREDEARAAPSRGCGPAGCALPGWVRVGWGETAEADDMKPAEVPSSSYVPLKVSPTIHYDCAISSVATQPLPDKRPVVPPPRARPGVRGAPVAIRQHDTQWASFRNRDAPALAADEYGVDNGTSTSDSVFLRAYAWGRAGSDWTRSGRWTIRFDDRFDVSGGVRASAVTASPWAHQSEALEAIGTNASYGSGVWHAFLDPAGRTLLASSCRGQSCALYSVGEGQPILPIRTTSGGAGSFTRPFDNGAVRVGETWFFLSQTSSYDAVALFRADLGVARQIGTYHRTSQRYDAAALRLVRRAFGSGIGLLIGGSPEPGERSGLWYVLPVDPETGTLGEAVALARRDFAGTALPRCAAEQDGWTIDVTPDATSNVELDNARAALDAVEMRVRLDPGRACVESLATRSGAFNATERVPGAFLGVVGGRPPPARVVPKALTSVPPRKGGADDRAVPMAVTEKYTGRRWGLACKVRH
jgi:hypothetical protein